MGNLETELRYRFYDRSLPFTVRNDEIRNDFDRVVGVIKDGETIRDYAMVIDTLATLKPCFRQFDTLVSRVEPTFIELGDGDSIFKFDIKDSGHIKVTNEVTNRRRLELFKDNSVFYNDSGREVSIFETSIGDLRDLILQITENENSYHTELIDAFTNGGFEESGDVTAAEALNYGEVDEESNIFGDDSPTIKALQNSGADEYSIIVYKPEDPEYDEPYATLYLGKEVSETSDRIIAYKLIPCDWVEDDVHSFISDFNDFCEISKEMRQEQEGVDVTLSQDDLNIVGELVR